MRELLHGQTPQNVPVYPSALIALLVTKHFNLKKLTKEIESGLTTASEMDTLRLANLLISQLNI